MSSYFVLAFLWILFCAVQSLLAAPALKARVSASWPGLGAAYGIVYNLVALLSLGGVLWYQYSFRSPNLLEPSMPLVLLALLACLSGAVLMGYCIFRYFPFLSGLKPAEAGKTFLASGPNKLVRHPLYLGTLVFVYGLFLLFPTIANLIAIVAITAYVILGIELEEKKLREAFGESYRDYCSKVKKLIPGIY